MKMPNQIGNTFKLTAAVLVYSCVFSVKALQSRCFSETQSRLILHTASQQTNNPDDEECESTLPELLSIDLSKMSNKKLVWYFSYGANMSRGVLAGRHKISPEFSYPARVKDPDFDVLSFSHRGGFATLIGSSDPAARGTVSEARRTKVGTTTKEAVAKERAPATREAQHVWQGAHGVLHAVPLEAVQGTLARVESGYRLRTITVQPYGCEELINAKAFVSSPLLKLSQSLPPSTRYLSLIKQGAKEHQLEESYIDWLYSIESIEHASSMGKEYFETSSNIMASVLGVCTSTMGLYFYYMYCLAPH